MPILRIEIDGRVHFEGEVDEVEINDHWPFISDPGNPGYVTVWAQPNRQCSEHQA